MDYNRIADYVKSILGIDTPPNTIAAGAAALINAKPGDVSKAIGAYIDPTTRQLVIPGNLRKRYVFEDFAGLDSNDAVAVLQVTGAARATTTGLMHLMTTPGGNVFGCANIGVQTTSPVTVANGLDIRGVETAAIGTELFSHGPLMTGKPFIVGNDPAFFFRVSLTIADISGAGVLIAGFRRCEANNITYTSYNDYGSIGVIASADPGAINIAQEINAAGTSPTDTTNTWADGATKVFEIRVSATGVVTYLINGVAPLVVAAQTFDDGDPLIPFVHFIQASDIAGEVTVNTWEAGLQ